MSQSSTVAALRSLAGEQAQAGWQALVDQHGADVWRLILSRSRDTNEAEDVYQDFWLGLPRSAVSFKPAESADPERAARAWLMRVAYTTAIDRVRRRRPATVDVNADAKGAAMDSQSVTARLVAQDHIRPGTEDLHDREFLVARVQGALKDLPENYRRPLLLYVVGGLSYEELAADLRCTVNNARVRVHRGLKRLREVLGGEVRLVNERALAGLILPVMLTAPQAPSLSAALSTSAAGVSSAAVGAGSITSGATGGTIVAVAVGTSGVVAAGIVLTVMLAGAPAAVPPVVPPAPTAIVRLLDDFNRAESGIKGHSFIRVTPEISLVPAPAGGGGGSALRMGWSAEHNTYIDCAYDPSDRQPLIGVTATAATVVSMQVWAPQTTRLTHLAIRFTDADGEIFEWRHPLPDEGKTGWRTVEFRLDPAQASQWDTQPIVNHRVETPMKLRGYAVAIARDNSQEGVVIIDDVQMRVPQAQQVAGKE